MKWWRKAADQGNAGAQYHLGVVHAKGQGVEKDFKQAMKWSHDAAVQGHAEAQYLVGAIYETWGDRTADVRDYVTAYAWYDLASKNGNHNAKIRTVLLAGKVTLDQINKAKSVVNGMIKKNPKLIQKND